VLYDHMRSGLYKPHFKLLFGLPFTTEAAVMRATTEQQRMVVQATYMPDGRSDLVPGSTGRAVSSSSHLRSLIRRHPGDW
jgi:hypothetical protein